VSTGVPTPDRAERWLPKRDLTDHFRPSAASTDGDWPLSWGVPDAEACRLGSRLEPMGDSGGPSGKLDRALVLLALARRVRPKDLKLPPNWARARFMDPFKPPSPLARDTKRGRVACATSSMDTVNTASWAGSVFSSHSFGFDRFRKTQGCCYVTLS
jgi:hypothetical protein